MEIKRRRKISMQVAGRHKLGQVYIACSNALMSQLGDPQRLLVRTLSF